MSSRRRSTSRVFLCGLVPFVAHAQPVPNDADVADLYRSSCMACHASVSSGAPLTGDHDAWATRVPQGMESLVAHTIDGIRGMPPLGSCADCTYEDFEALIRFMAGIGNEEGE